MQPVSLRDLASRYVGAKSVCSLQAKIIRGRASALQNFVGTDSLEACLREDELNRFLASLAVRLQPITVRGYRGDLLSLWNYAADRDLVPYPQARRIHRPKVRLPCPECFALGEAKQLLAAASDLEGRYDARTKSEYWRAAILAGWETGLRRSDVWRIRKADLARGRLVFASQKTGVRTVHSLTDSAIAAIGRVGTLAWPLSVDMFAIHFARLVELSGVGRGTFRWFRRSSGSYVAATAGASAGAEHLGHTSLSTFRKHYDARLVDERDRPAPPQLEA